ncbi:MULTISPECIES: ParB N-terminal domain-containing protein [Mesorhizobium]|uniref:ParB N-terminal domain-containing protein n=1 Tax=Mesorhizobium ciceri TaxID=39645 RepID=A0AB38TE74_9HYPH|nr:MULTISPECIES: ParB N-terminal domain-containing protein [Mesorhizobium]MDF3218615.1 ParB N-terminal domain-containing protein [Mesorhizobium ciceri]UTU53103.1 ParB N-terminal domain-containing protein [Mesorhizobium ciceri]
MFRNDFSFGTAHARSSANAPQTEEEALPSAQLISSYTIVKLPVSQLRPSEEINIERARTLAKMIAETGRWTRPIFVEHRHSVIMDGHHRLFCAGELGLLSVPCILLSYDDPNLHVTYWSEPGPVNVESIIQAALSGDLMGFKTTNHKLQIALPCCSIDLDDLR